MASVTCLNPVLNGGLASYMCFFDIEKSKFPHPKQDNGGFFDAIFARACKGYSLASNLLGTSSNAPREIIDYRLRDFSSGDRKELIYTLKTQKYI